MPPGLASKLLGTRISDAERIAALSTVPFSARYLYPDTNDFYYRYGDGYMSRPRPIVGLTVNAVRIGTNDSSGIRTVPMGITLIAPKAASRSGSSVAAGTSAVLAAPRDKPTDSRVRARARA